MGNMALQLREHFLEIIFEKNFSENYQLIFAKIHSVRRRLLVKWKLTYACLLLLPADLLSRARGLSSVSVGRGGVDDAVSGVPGVQKVAVRWVRKRHAAAARQHHLGPSCLAHYTLLETRGPQF